MYQIKRWNTGPAIKGSLLFTPHLVLYLGETVHKSEYSVKFQMAEGVDECLLPCSLFDKPSLIYSYNSVIPSDNVIFNLLLQKKVLKIKDSYNHQ